MAKSTDEMFIGDLEECLRLAEELEKVDTEDTKLFVSEQLQKLHKFLQTKQIETEDRIEEQIIKEEHEIEDLKARIARVSQGNGDESDLDYADLEELWRVLKDDYWRAAFYAYIAETTEPADAIINNLLAILKASYDHCKIRVEKSHSDIMFQVFFPGENAQQDRNLKLPTQPDKDLVSMCKKCQMRSTPFCLSSIKQVVVQGIKEDRSVSRQFQTRQKPLLRALEGYLNQCVEFCWIASFEEPEVQLVTNPAKECKALAGKFIEFDRITYKKRENAAIVEWPAIVQGENVRIQWQLFTINQPRPQPDKRRLPDNDYRVTKTEDPRGREVVDGSDEMKDQTRHDSYGNAASKDQGTPTKRDPPRQDKKTTNESMTHGPNNEKTKIKNETSKKENVESKGKENKVEEVKSNNDNTKYSDSKAQYDKQHKNLKSF